jgi:hypothetical protein
MDNFAGIELALNVLRTSSRPKRARNSQRAS